MKFLGASPLDIIRDILIVVIGILVAFWLNNWYNGEQDKKEEQVILIGLRSDYEQNRTQIESKLEIVQRFQRHCTNALSHMGQANATISDEKMDSIFTSTLGIPTFDPVEGALTQLLNANKMNLLRNSSLRNLLSTWSSYMQEVKETEEVLIERSRTNAIYLEDKVDLTGHMSQGINSFVIDHNSAFTTDKTDLFMTLKFENIVGGQLFYLNGLEYRYHTIESEIAKILEILNNEIR